MLGMKDAAYEFDDAHYHKLKKKLLEMLKEDQEEVDEDDILDDIDDETLYEILSNKQYLLRLRKKLKMIKQKRARRAEQGQKGPGKGKRSDPRFPEPSK